MKKWIKLLKAYDGKPEGERIEVEEPVAKALVTAGIAEESTEDTLDLLVKSATAEFTAAIQQHQKDTDAKIETLVKALKESGASLKRPTMPVIEAGESEDDKALGSGGFKGLGHFAVTVIKATDRTVPNLDAQTLLRSHTERVDRVTKAFVAKGGDFVQKAPSGMSEGVDPDGGALIPPDYSTQIWDRTRTTQDLLARCRTITIAGNTYTMPADAETSRVDGSRHGGTRGYWENEADQYTKSKPTFRRLDFKLNKLTVLTFLTNEQLQDTPQSLDAYLNYVSSDEIGFKIGDALVNGTGTGQPLGVRKAKCYLAITKETGQAAATLDMNNISKMWQRFYAPSRANSIWIHNQDIEQQLDTLALPIGTAGAPMYLPAGSGLVEAAPARLKGRPMIPVEWCQTIGTEGDLILGDWSQYQVITKGGVMSAMSIHLRFDFDETVFKWTFRMDGQPLWSDVLTPFKGTNTQSPFIGIATRA